MRHIITILLVLYCLFTAPLYAQTIQVGSVNVSQEIIELKAQIALLADRLAQIEQSEAERLTVEAERVVIALHPRIRRRPRGREKYVSPGTYDIATRPLMRILKTSGIVI